MRDSHDRTDNEPPSPVETLLALLSPALRVEPTLLRAMRRLIPGADAGIEARCWNHPDLAPSLAGGAVRPERIAHYREDFRRLPVHIKRAAAEVPLVQHRHLPAAMRAEEAATLAWLAGWEEHEGEAFLQRAAKTLIQGDGYPWPSQLEGWSRRLLARQPSGIYAASDALATLFAEVHREALERGEVTLLPDDFPLERVSWVWGRGGKRRRYRLIQLGTGLVRQAESPPGASRGSPVAEAVLSSPGVAWRLGDGPEQLTALTEPLPLPEAERHLHLRTGAGLLELGLMTAPPWAEVLGRDGQGLFAQWPDGRRLYWPECPEWADAAVGDEYGIWADFSVHGITQRMRWIEQRSFLMGSPEGEPERESWGNDETQHEVTLTQGYRLAETACTQALWRAVFGESITPEQVNYDGIYPYHNGKKGRGGEHSQFVLGGG